MIGANGRAVSALDPEGTVNIKGELWQAISSGDPITTGELITVVDQDELTLTVARRNNADAKAAHR